MVAAFHRRQLGAAVLRRTALMLVVAVGALAALPSASRAAPLNVISSMSNSVSPGSAPVNSLPPTSSSGPQNGKPDARPTSTSISPVAGSDDDYSQSLRFSYGGSPSYDSPDGAADETVQTLDLDLPPGVLASLAAAQDFCTPSELGTMPVPNGGAAGTGWLGAAPDDSGCPADSQIGELRGTAIALGSVPVPLTGNLYLEKATSSADVAEVAVEVESSLSSSFSAPFKAEVASGPIRFVTDSSGQPQLQVALTLPGVATLDSGDTAATLTVSYALETLTQTINGLTPAGRAFTLMPSSDATATATAGVAVQNNSQNGTVPGATVAGVAGSGAASITPVDAGSLPYSPGLEASVVRDGSDANVALDTTITQGDGQSASRRIVLRLPATLQPNLTNALTALCTDPTADASNCVPVGTVTAVTPLLTAPLTGNVYLTGTAVGPYLTLAFPAPVGLVISGAIDLVGRTVTFAQVPDMPLTSLAVTITGGADGIYETTCTSGADAGVVSGVFTGQNGALASSTGSFSVAGCPTVAPALRIAPAPSLRLTGAPTVLVRVRHLTRRGGRVTVQVRHNRDSAAFAALTISAPAGLGYNRTALDDAVAVIGARIRSATLKHGRLQILLRAPVRGMYVTISRSALRESLRLARRIAAHRAPTLRYSIAFTTTALQSQTVRVTARA